MASEAKHTPEPPVKGAPCEVCGTTLVFVGREFPKLSTVSCPRCIACVNACASIPTEQLEAGCVGKLLAVARGVVHACSSPMGTAYELPRLLSEAGNALAPFQKGDNK